MAKVTEPITRDQFEEFLKQFVDNALRQYDEGKVDIECGETRSFVEVTRPGDMVRNYEPGPTWKFDLTMRNPYDRRREEWL